MRFRAKITPESRDFWRGVADGAQIADAWPGWKKGSSFSTPCGAQETETMADLVGTRLVLYKNTSDSDRAPIYNAVFYQDNKVVAEAGLWVATDKDSGEPRTDSDGNQYLSGNTKAPYKKKS